MERLLPRHMQIIYLINAAHLDSARKRGLSDPAFMASISLIDEHGGRRVRMGSLAFIGSHKINGVSALHTNLMRETVFHDLDAVYPERIINKTNGITFRRWLIECNPRLTGIIKAAVGQKALYDAETLQGLAKFADDSAMQEQIALARRANKVTLSQLIAETLNQRVDPDALFDVQIKRIHEYKRQLLNILETIARYNEIRANPTMDFAPRVKIFAGKAAASYTQAKLIIKLAIDVARTVNSDPTVRGLLKVVFLPNYNVSLAEIDHPGGRPLRADLHRGHGGLRHRQHEDGAQRRADHRHARRRQCRIARPRRRSQHLHLRPHRRRSRGLARAASTRAPASRPRRSCAKCSTQSVPAYSPPTIASATRASSIRCATTIISWSAPISTPIGRRRCGSTPLARQARRGCAPAS